MTTILLCAAVRRFSLLFDPFDCQPFTAEQSDLLTVGYFGDVVSKAIQYACIPQFQVITNMVLVKIPNAVLMYFLEFPYIQHVFIIVQAVSLSAMECLRTVLLYGFKFQTAKVLMFGLD